MDYLENRFDSCSVQELRQCRKYAVEYNCEVHKLRKSELMKDFPKTKAGFIFKQLGLKRDIKTIDDIIKRLEKSGHRNYRTYKEAQKEK